MGLEEHYEARRRCDNHIVHVLYMGETTSVSLEGLWWDVDTGNFYLGSELDMASEREKNVLDANIKNITE